MQFSGMFRSLHFPFPVLIPRETFLFLGPREIRYIEKTNRTLAQLIGKKETVLQHCIKESFDAFSDEPWNKILTEESEKWAGIFAEADPTLQAAVMAKFANLKRDLKALNAKRIRSIKHKEQNLVQRLEHLQDWMQPKGILQERIQHPWLLGPELKLHFQELLSHSNPIQNQVVVLKF
jgi:bacillithiol synthase